MVDGDAPGLNLKQVASRLGVHYMTAYRYVRQGRIAAVRAGTEWRVADDELARFAAAGGDAARTSTRPAAEWASRFEHSLLEGDEPAAWRVVEGALASGHSPSGCYLDLVAASLESIGTRWAVGELDIADQYVATAVATRIVARLGARFRRPGRTRGTVVFGSPPGERHSLPVAIVADLARLVGFGALELGGDVPPEAFRAAVERSARVIAVGLGITSIDAVTAAQEVVDAVHGVNPDLPVIVGGQAAASPQARAMHGVAGFAPAGEDAIACLEGLAARERAPGGR